MYFCRVSWMMQYQGMVVLAGNQVWWTWEVEDVFVKVKQGAKTAMKVILLTIWSSTTFVS